MSTNFIDDRHTVNKETHRIQIGSRQRFEIFKRDNFTCHYCGRKAPDVTLEVDHIIPVINGGDNSNENLLTACMDCNRGKYVSEVVQEKNNAVFIPEIVQTWMEYAKELNLIEEYAALAYKYNILHDLPEPVFRMFYDAFKATNTKTDYELAVIRKYKTTLSRQKAFQERVSEINACFSSTIDPLIKGSCVMAFAFLWVTLRPQIA